MAYITSLLIVALCGYLIIMPFLQKKQRWQTTDIKDDLYELSKEQIFATLNELEMEYNMGKLPAEDYKHMKSQYEKLAAQKLKMEKETKEKQIEKKVGELPNSDVNVLDLDLEKEVEEELRKMKEKRKGE
ncbi:hypothetical protein LGQ02_16905 [Bacillus shivajii]|uniref:hypothetical protein n=1 Tax=Bacillus shivajii TaxID=1983719 RepID=UPI001CFB976A|nr:hypothetical protein [Bacillus shivajii]UCZ52499.1 hypothetical protein LGQ02_16905 [Bacillus shivajii]